MKAWGSGDEKVVAKDFELLFNAARSEDQARDPELPRRWQSKSTLGSGVGGPLFKKFHPHLTESVPQFGDLHPMTPGSVIVASVGSGALLAHSDVATHPEVHPPNRRDISGCDLSSFLCLSEDYQVAVQAGTALGEAGDRNSVGLDPEKHILGCPGAWLMRIRLIIEFSTPKIGGVGT